MPILDVDEAAAVIVIKRSMNPGFAGIDNPLYDDPEDARCCSGTRSPPVSEITAELQASSESSSAE